MRKILALFLVAALILALVPTAVLAAAMPCGHTDSDPAGHMPAGCWMPGHYRCDGKEHSFLCVFGGDDDEGLFPPAFSMPPTPPGKKPPANPPTKVEVPKDGSDADLKPKYEEREEYQRSAFYTLEFTNSQCTANDWASSHGSEAVSHYVLNLVATSRRFRIGGAWTGYGNLTMNLDMSAEMAKDPDWLEGVFDLDGPLEYFEFGVVEQTDESNAMLKKRLNAEVRGRARLHMDWKASVVEGSRFTGFSDLFGGRTYTGFAPSADMTMPLTGSLHLISVGPSSRALLFVRGLPDRNVTFTGGTWYVTVDWSVINR